MTAELRDQKRTTIPVGELEMRMHHDQPETHPYGQLEIARADPVIRVTAEVVESITRRMAMREDFPELPEWATLRGGVLRLTPDIGESYTYREVAYEWQTDTYVFAWPD